GGRAVVRPRRRVADGRRDSFLRLPYRGGPDSPTEGVPLTCMRLRAYTYGRARGIRLSAVAASGWRSRRPVRSRRNACPAGASSKSLDMPARRWHIMGTGASRCRSPIRKGNDMKALTIAAAKAALAARAPAMTLRKTDGGDFRVTFTQAAIAAAFPAMTRAELIEKAESLAAYESDAESALATGLAMAETGLQPAPATAEAAPAPEADKPGREYI